MMLDLESNETLEVYDEVFKEFSSKPVCLVEGNNKFFYQQIKELYTYVVEDGGSCIDIIKTISESKDKIGIIDNDYRPRNEYFENIVKINYYSIENIVLEKISEFQPLVDVMQQKIMFGST